MNPFPHAPKKKKIVLLPDDHKSTSTTTSFNGRLNNNTSHRARYPRNSNRSNGVSKRKRPNKLIKQLEKQSYAGFISHPYENAPMKISSTSRSANKSSPTKNKDHRRRSVKNNEKTPLNSKRAKAKEKVSRYRNQEQSKSSDDDKDYLDEEDDESDEGSTASAIADDLNQIDSEEDQNESQSEEEILEDKVEDASDEFLSDDTEEENYLVIEKFQNVTKLCINLEKVNVLFNITDEAKSTIEDSFEILNKNPSVSLGKGIVKYIIDGKNIGADIRYAENPRVISVRSIFDPIKIDLFERHHAYIKFRDVLQKFEDDYRVLVNLYKDILKLYEERHFNEGNKNSSSLLKKKQREHDCLAETVFEYGKRIKKKLEEVGLSPQIDTKEMRKLYNKSTLFPDDFLTLALIEDKINQFLSVSGNPDKKVVLKPLTGSFTIELQEKGSPVPVDMVTSETKMVILIALCTCNIKCPILSCSIDSEDVPHFSMTLQRFSDMLSENYTTTLFLIQSEISLELIESTNNVNFVKLSNKKT